MAFCGVYPKSVVSMQGKPVRRWNFVVVYPKGIVSIRVNHGIDRCRSVACAVSHGSEHGEEELSSPSTTGAYHKNGSHKKRKPNHNRKTKILDSYKIVY